MNTEHVFSFLIICTNCSEIDLENLWKFLHKFLHFQSKANEEHRKLEEEVEKIRTKLDDVKSGKQVEDECINADDYTKNYPAKIPSFLHDFVQRKRRTGRDRPLIP